MNIRKSRSIINRMPAELIAWTGGLILAWLTAHGNIGAFSLCPLYNLGIDFCLGCGLGTSVGLILHGQFVQAFNTHLLGVFALGILIYRIIVLINYEYRSIKDNKTGTFGN